MVRYCQSQNFNPDRIFHYADKVGVLMIRKLIATISSVPAVRKVGASYRRHLQATTKPDSYERVAFSKPVGFFAIGERSALAIMRNGTKVRVNTADHVGRVLYAMGDFQPRISEVIRRLLEKGDTVIDIGANVGWFVATSAPLVGHAGKVIAFEPQPDIAEMLRETISLNDLRQVALNEFALSASDGEMSMHILAGNSGAGRLAVPTGEGEWRTVSVKVRNAFDVLTELNLSKIRMLKIDVEGHEGPVLEACEPYLIENPADVVIFESNAHGEAPFFSRVPVMALHRMGYRFFQFDSSVEGSTLREVRSDGEGTEFENDFVALHSGTSFDTDVKRLGAAPGPR